MNHLKTVKISLPVIIALFFLFLCPRPAAGREDLNDLAVGQGYTFNLAWNGIPVGTVSTRVEEVTEVRGRKAYKVVLRAMTNKWASLIYKVDDRFVTYIDYESSSSLRHELARSEGRYRKRAVIDYLYGKFLAEYRYLKDGREKTVDVAADIHDPVSAVYFFLRKDFSAGDEIILNIDLNEKHHRLFARIEKGRSIRIPRIGRFDSVLIRPYVERKEKPYRRGSGWGLVSVGDKKLPLFAVVRVFVWGRFSATLSDYSP